MSEGLPKSELEKRIEELQGEDGLSDWEEQFLDSLLEWVRAFREPTEAQMMKLEEIEDKLEYGEYHGRW